MSSINNRLNRIIKTLAVISVVTLPLTVITSFFGMNFADTIPGFTKPFTFVAAMLLMISLPFVFFFFSAKTIGFNWHFEASEFCVAHLMRSHDALLSLPDIQSHRAELAV
jgi:CorA-like Mg2+ transporter protein